MDVAASSILGAWQRDGFLHLLLIRTVNPRFWSIADTSTQGDGCPLWHLADTLSGAKADLGRIIRPRTIDDIPHSIKYLGSETGRELTVSSPGGVFDAFIEEVASSMTVSGSPASGPVADFRSIAAKYGIEFLG
jgi:hypothetical protein